jgi:hypothetical protein
MLTQQCKKAFRKDMREYEEADEYCPHCDNQYVSSSCGHERVVCGANDGTSLHISFLHTGSLGHW